MSALHPRAGGVSVRSVNYATSPLLASKTPPWRSRLLVAMVGIGFTALLARAAYVQVIGTDFFQQQGEKRYVHTLQMPASRGRILDRNGALLATSVAAPSVWAIPKDLNPDSTPAQRAELARLLGMNPPDLEKRLQDNPNFVWLRRQVEDETWAKVKALNLKGVHQVSEFKRRYPEGEAAAHVVGFTGVEQTGQEGIELAFQRELQGKDGSREVVKDRLGRVIEDVGQQLDPIDGRDITLSIDAKVQFFAYQRIRDAVAEHKAKAGSVVVVDVQTGEVLALANYPSYDPADRGKLNGNQLRNRALTDTFEPGSTMKPFIAAQSLETGRVRVDTPVVTGAGSLVVGGSTIRDAHAHPMLTVAEVIQKSSNIGAARLALQMPPREMWELYSNVGFGHKPQLKFPGAVTGRLRPWKTWKPIEQATMAYGYGLSASLLQIAQAYTAFARDGEVVPVSMFKQDAPPPGLRVFKPETARQVRKMLQMAAGPGGTGPLAQTIGYSVGGKSGTAHKQEGRGYASNKYRSWFVGLAPVDKPRVIVAVMVDEPSNGKYFGGAVAAPVFSQVVQHTLRLKNVEPDLEVKPQIVTKAVPAEPESF
ncbi:peptidoglycan D,D-transpeptidase FtsI family protein [Azohydromonas australica]|uniref:peptidoglycan D,D-transpeptidase FtsI family protein n=1 Tax=Azohydromonas australica TaxID=364039 RepID=UPI0003FD57A0|nr:penicillin-binding protein 2 [Azohydromonas australica]